MSLTNPPDWDDIPTSSELFGGDFFGDELMEMYSAEHGLNLGETASSAIISTSSAHHHNPEGLEEDDDAHPGVLIAMNAAAMDGGLSPLGSSPEFVPHVANSDGSQAPLPAYPILSTKTTRGKSVAPTPTAVTSSNTPVATAAAVAAAKRPIAAVASAAGQGLKKQRKGAASASIAPSKAKAPAQATKKKVIVPPSAPPTVTTRAAGSIAKASTVKAAAPPAPKSLGVPPQPVTTTAVPSTAVSSKTAFPPKPAVPVSNQQVRPNPVPSSVLSSSGAHRILPPSKPMVGLTRPTIPLPPSTGGVKRAHSEADFKDVASAAVTSLIQNASSTIKTQGTKPIPKVGEKAVDTSTAHINALTSQNWVTACNPIPPPDTSSSSAASACDKAARNARRATLTQEERAKQNRDRNREHARNTRLRKKAYVEELKRTLTELVSQRDAADLEKRHEAQRNREQREVRFRVMEEFLKLRGRNELNAARWVAILEDGFTFTLPRTTFRKMVDGDSKAASSSDVDNKGEMSHPSSSLEQVLRGATAVVEDSSYLSTYLQCVGGPATVATQVQITYKCDRKRFFMDNNIAFMDFTATTVGATAKGAPSEATFKGQMRSSFSPASNKLISVEMTFDSGTFLDQVRALADVVSSTSDAAAAAAHDADALLDSLPQMPTIAAAAAATTGSVSVSSDDGESTTCGK